jgi:hypothetical protein
MRLRDSVTGGTFHWPRVNDTRLFCLADHRRATVRLALRAPRCVRHCPMTAQRAGDDQRLGASIAALLMPRSFRRSPLLLLRHLSAGGDPCGR